MTPLRRAPRQVYRVYGEDEFLMGLDKEHRPDATTPTADREKQPTALGSAVQASSPRRMARTALLIACLGVAVGLIATSRPSPESGTALRSSRGTGAATRSSLQARVPEGRRSPDPRSTQPPRREGWQGARPRARRIQATGASRPRSAVSHLRPGALARTDEAYVARLPGSTGSWPGPAEAPEFGFER
jgi:hypothetical protein